MFNIENTSYGQLSFFRDPIFPFLDHSNRYFILKKGIDWSGLVADISAYYSDKGRKSIPLRTMIGLTIVKFIENISDERVIQLYLENPYVQAFCGQVEFQNVVPCSNAMLSVFRNKIGEKGCARILGESIKLHGILAHEEAVVVDTTAQPKNVTYPTDMKLILKVIEKCQETAQKYNISLKNTFKSEVHSLLPKIRFDKSSKNSKAVRKAKKRLVTIAGILVRELKRKLDSDLLSSYEDEFIVYEKVIVQANDKRNPSQKLQEEIEKLEEILDDTINLLESNGVKIKDSEKEKIDNIRENYKNAKGRGKQKSLSESITAEKKVIRSMLKRLKKSLNLDELLGIESAINKINDSLISSKKDTKIYSIHEPGVACIAKGKAGVKYEFGSKASIVVTKDSGIIVGAVNFQGNPHDSNTMADSIDNVRDNIGKTPSDAYADRGYRGAREKNKDIKVHLPETPSDDATEEEKENARKNFGRRSAIEPVIGHLKSDFRLKRTYLKGKVGDQINLSLSCAAFNFTKFIRIKLEKMQKYKTA